MLKVNDWVEKTGLPNEVGVGFQGRVKGIYPVDTPDYRENQMVVVVLLGYGRDSSYPSNFKRVPVPLAEHRDYLDLGLDYLSLSLYQDARIAFEDCLLINPTCAEAWYYKGIAYERLGQDGLAKHCFRQSAKKQEVKSNGRNR